jgi:hypothetical protein
VTDVPSGKPVHDPCADWGTRDFFFLPRDLDYLGDPNNMGTVRHCKLREIKIKTKTALAGKPPLSCLSWIEHGMALLKCRNAEIGK